MSNQHETKPHILKVRKDMRCWGCVRNDPKQWCSTRCLLYDVACPYVGDERLHVCMAYEECRCTLPDEPPLPEPERARDWDADRGRLLDMGGTGYAFGSDIVAVAAWSAYWRAHDDHDDEHPFGWAPTGDCWVQTGDHCWPEPLEGWPGSSGVPNEPGVYRVSVDNDGHYEDSVLVLELWPEEVADGEATTQERLVTA